MCDGRSLTDGSFIADENSSQVVGEHSHYERTAPSRAPSPILHPKAHSYYAFAEDTHPTTRIAAASKLFQEERLAPRLEPHAARDPRTEDEVTDRYLKSDPTSFVIFGKPGSDGADVASAIANARNCVLISPVSVIRREIDADTENGRRMERELRLGERIGPEIVMNLIRRRAGKRDVKHRGYVVEGLPLLPNNAKLDYSSYSTSTSDKNGTEFCENAMPGGDETCDRDRFTPRSCRNSPDGSNCGAQIDHVREIPRQINEIFTVWPVKPRIIIYIVCPKQDVASRCARRRTENNPIDGSEHTTRPLDGERDKSNASFNFHLVTDEWPIVPDDRRIYSARRISERGDNIEAQCDLYERLALPVIDEWILAYNPEHVIRVDGRSSARRTLGIIDARLCVLPLQPSILPERIAKWCDENPSETSSEMATGDEEFAERSAEEIFQVLRRREVVSPKFPWRLSAWRFYCPVELARGRTVKGLPSCPVRFLNKIFFLSSQQAENLFVENPRTFLSSPNPRPTCKIAVLGPKFAGKSELTARLAKVFGGTVINVDQILREAIKDKKALDIERETNLSYGYAPEDSSRAEELSARGSHGNDSDAQITSEYTRDEFIEMSADEKADVIVQNVKRVPVERLEDELYRDGGYVVDGMRADVEVWRKVVDEGNVAFEDVVVLFEDKPYVYMLEKFHSFARIGDSSREGEYGAETEEYEIPQEEWEYFEHLKQFDSDWARFEKCLSEFRGNVVRCNLAGVKDAAAEYVINHIKGRFDVADSASVKERDEETEISEESTIADDRTRLTYDESREEGEEECPIDLETAERLLECGYYFFSPFGRWCPVQMYNGEIFVQMFLPMRARGQIFPVVRRYYIYFVAGEEALAAFLKNPAKYLARSSSLLPPPPLRIAVVGPPKCGKTTLASRLAKTYGVKRITRGKALRHMLKHYGWMESARLTEDQLRAGETASIELVARAVEMLSIGPRASSQGYVLDGCPADRDEAERLALSGVQPMIVLDLKTDLPFCLECLSRDNDDARRPLNFPASFLSLRYANWQKHQADFREWLKKFSQSVIELNATRSKWYVWTRADRAVRSRFADVALYHRYANHDRVVLSLRYMCVSPYEFRSRQSQYESYCPVCLLHEGILKVSDQPTDGRGMVQFREHFYWICPRHVDAFTKDPLRHLPPVNTASLPDERPRVLEQTVDSKHACWAQRLRVDGLCLVTYVDGLPGRELTRGRADLAVLLKDQVYLFCSETCRDKFLSQPGKYSEADIPSPRAIPSFDAWRLPDLGFLEHTVSRAVIEAVTRVAARRPKIFGLSAAVSAAIHIGVHLKTRAASREADIYEAASERMAGWDKIIRTATDTMKRKLNPYVFLPQSAAPPDWA